MPRAHRANPRIYDLSPKTPHFEPKAKSVIQLFMNGGPSQVDMFDPKPALSKYEGTIPSRDLINDILFSRETAGVWPSPFKFSKHGESGMDFSELVPHMAECADEIAMIRSMQTTHINHEPALFMMHQGELRPTGRHWEHGSPTGSVPRTRTFRRTSSSTIPRAYPSTVFRTGNRPSCLRFIRGRGSARKAPQCSTWSRDRNGRSRCLKPSVVC